MLKQRQAPYSFNRVPSKREKAEENAGKMRDGVMVPAALRSTKMTAEEIAAEIARFSPKPPGKS